MSIVRMRQRMFPGNICIQAAWKSDQHLVSLLLIFQAPLWLTDKVPTPARPPPTMQHRFCISCSPSPTNFPLLTGVTLLSGVYTNKPPGLWLALYWRAKAWSPLLFPGLCSLSILLYHLHHTSTLGITAIENLPENNLPQAGSMTSAMLFACLCFLHLSTMLQMSNHRFVSPLN